MCRVLIVVDDYTSAETATRHVLSGAALGPVEEVMLLHVHPPIRSYAGQFFRPRALQAMREAAGRRLLGDAVAMLDGAGIRAGFLSVLGAPAPTVADAARAGGTDAIVMGSPGGGFFARLMFRLLVWQVVRQASVPVHIVGEYGTARVRETARRPWRPAYTH